MNESKSIFKSKTFWFNVAIGVMALVSTQFSDDSELPDTADGQVVFWLAFVGSVINVILRTVTKTPVSIKKSAKSIGMGFFVLMIVVLLASSVQAADTMVVHNKSGYWLLHIPDEGTPTLTRPTVLGPQSDNPNPIPPNGDNGGDDREPEPDTRLSRMIQVTKSLLEERQGKGFAYVVDTLYQEVKKGRLDEDDIEKAFKQAINLAKNVLGGGDALSQWEKTIRNDFGNGEWSKELLKESLQALAQGFDVSGFDLVKIEKAVVDDSSEVVAAAQDVEQALGIPQLMLLIKMIMQIIELISNGDIDIGELHNRVDDSICTWAIDRVRREEFTLSWA